MGSANGNQTSRFSAWSAVLGAVLASVIVAIAGFAGPLSLQQREERQAERTEQENARGAARLLFAEYIQAGAQMAILSGDRILRRFDHSYRIAMRPEDMRLIASNVGMEEWGAIQVSLANVVQLETFVNTQLERGRRYLTKGEVCLVLGDLRSVRVAGEALAPLAEATGQPPPPKPLNCKYKPGPVPKAFAPPGYRRP